MKLNNKWLFLVLVTAFSVMFLMSSGNVEAVDGGYLGTGNPGDPTGTSCLSCHDGSYPGAADKSGFLQAGHAYKFRTTGGADCSAGACDALSNILPTPLISGINTATLNGLIVSSDGIDLDWSAIEHVIGGWGWKARFGIRDYGQDGDPNANDDTGHIWAGTTIQYNINVPAWGSQYNGTDKVYNCSDCHNTNGIVDTTPGLRALPSVLASYGSQHTFEGVQCEACHANAVRVASGANSSNGMAHAADPTGVDMMGIAGSANVTFDVCGRCHNRHSGHEPNPTAGAATSGGYIRHHESYDEMMGTGNGAHKNLQCTSCHNPHIRSHKVPDGTGGTPDVATALGITDNNIDAVTRGAVVACSTCHSAIAAADTKISLDLDGINAGNTTAHDTLSCADCHLAEATKSATAKTGTGGGKKGDVKSHIFRIDTSATGVDTASVNPAREALSLEYVCLKCHDLSMGEPGVTTALTKATAAPIALRYHQLSVTTVDGGYAGSNVCSNCHQSKYNDWQKSGHPYKFRTTGGADCSAGACDALSNVLPTPLIASIDDAPGGDDLEALAAANPDPANPASIDWSAIEFVIGGFGWKARYGVRDPLGVVPPGYIWPGANGNQWNALVGSWGSQYAGQDKKFNCSDCHNTNGIVDTTPGLRALPVALGVYGSQHTFESVQCEACHADAVRVSSGANSSNALAHITTGVTMGVAETGVDNDGDGLTDSKDLCGRCHNRHSGHEPDFNAGAATSGGFIRHHESYDELVGSAAERGVHAALSCTTCHDPHKRSHKVPDATATALGITDNDQTAEARGAVVSCESCHGPKTLRFAMGDIQCIDCHMGMATKSATGTTSPYGAKQGDVKSHIFKISTDPLAEDTAASNPAHNYLTLNYACGACHVGAKQAASFAASAQGMHSLPPSDAPAAARFNWYHGSNCYQVNFDASMNSASSLSWDFGGTCTNGPSTTAAVTNCEYDAAGSYAVTLTLDAGLATERSRTMIVTAKGKKKVPNTVMSVSTDASLDPTGMTAEVTDGSSDSSTCAGTVDGGTAVVLWGDGTTTVDTLTVGESWTHQYSVPGTYTVRYSVKDTQGNKSMSAPVTITVPDLTSAVCAVSGNVSTTAPAAVFNAMIYLKNGSTIVKMGKTDSAGDYSIPGVQAGIEYTIEAAKNGYTFSTASLTLDCDTLTGNASGNNLEATSIW